MSLYAECFSVGSCYHDDIFVFQAPCLDPMYGYCYNTLDSHNTEDLFLLITTHSNMTILQQDTSFDLYPNWDQQLIPDEIEYQDIPLNATYDKESIKNILQFSLSIPAMVAASIFINHQLGTSHAPLIATALTLTASGVGYMVSEMDNVVGDVGKFINENAVRIFAVNFNFLFSEAILGHPYPISLKYTIMNAALSVFTHTFSKGYEALEELMEDGLDYIKGVEMEPNTSNNRVPFEELLEYLKHEFIDEGNVIKRFAKEMVKYICSNGVSRDMYNILKDYSVVTFFSESIGGVVKHITWERDISEGMMILSIAIGVAKAIGKSLVKGYNDDYVSSKMLEATSGSIAANVIKALT